MMPIADVGDSDGPTIYYLLPALPAIYSVLLNLGLNLGSG